MTPPNILDQTLKQLAKILRSPGCRKIPIFVKDIGMAVELAGSFVQEKSVFSSFKFIRSIYKYKIELLPFS